MKSTILEDIKIFSLDLGFSDVGFVKVPVELRIEYYKKWIQDGKHAGMKWMEYNNDRRYNPEKIIKSAKGVLVFTMNYYQRDPKRNYRIAKYALGEDYHKIILKRLKIICSYMKENYNSEQKPYVDTGPIMEKPIAEKANLGWQGKSTILIDPKNGTWSFLGVIVTNLEIISENKNSKNYCGKCTKCIDVCPTNAIIAPYKLDANKCIAYLTIEHKGAIPKRYRRLIGNRLFGCDECLDVCPWNKWAKETNEILFKPKKLPILRKMLYWDEDEFLKYLKSSPMKRLKLERFKRNIALVLGNIGQYEDIKALKELSRSHNSVLKEQAEWSINEIELRQ